MPSRSPGSSNGYDVLRDAHQVRQLIGLTGQYASVDEGLSGSNNLIMIGRLLGLGRAETKARAAELLARFDLTDAAGRAAKTYSGGMRRRLDLAASLVGNPRVLYLDEADQLAHDIVVIDHGKVIATGTPDELKAKTGGRVLEAIPADPEQAAAAAALLTQLTRAPAAIDAERTVVTVPVPTEHVHADWRSVLKIRTNLEDVLGLAPASC